MFTRAPICIAAALVLPALSPPTAAQVTARFVDPSIEAIEGDGTVVLEVELDVTPPGVAVIEWETVAGTAESGSDFPHQEGAVAWTPGDPLRQSFPVTIFDDSATEGAETFTVRLREGDGAVPGDPDEASITIMDDDEGPRVWIDAGGARRHPVTGQYWLFFLEDSDISIPLRSDATKTEAPATLTIEVDGEPPIVDDFGIPGTVLYPWVVPDIAPDPTRVGTLTLERRGARGPEPSTVRILIADPLSFQIECLACSFYALYAITGFHDCPIECDGDFACAEERSAGPPPPPPIDLLRRYRDDVLHAQAGSRFYADLFESFADDAVPALLSSLTFMYRIGDGIGAWLDAVQAAVDGAGGTVTITPAMEAHVNEVLDGFAAAGPPALSNAIATHRAELELDAIAGLTMDELHTRVATAGSTPTISSTWSALKEVFR